MHTILVNQITESIVLRDNAAGIASLIRRYHDMENVPMNERQSLQAEYNE